MTSWSATPKVNRSTCHSRCKSRGRRGADCRGPGRVPVAAGRGLRYRGSGTVGHLRPGYQVEGNMRCLRRPSTSSAARSGSPQG
ncbi:hypothetical protein E1287_31750 [Actinomadura sp. KC06]|nr:hypothetical protein E1287_31750 [Actinomadura sp. KC06]